MKNPSVPEALRQFALAANALADALLAERTERLDDEVKQSRATERRQREPPVDPRPVVMQLLDREGLTKTEVKVLTALAQAGKNLSATQIGIRCGLSHTTGSFGQALANLRKDGLISGRSQAVNITSDGLEALGPFARLPEGSELFDYWCQKVGGAGAKILTCLRKRYREHPTALATAAQLGADTGLSHTTGSFGQALADLRKLELIQGGGGAIGLTPEMKLACEVTIGVFDTKTGKTVLVDRMGKAAR